MKVQKKLTIGFIRTKLNILSAINKRIAGEAAFKLFCTPFMKYNGPEATVFKNGEKLTLMVDGKKVVGYRCNHPQKKKALLLHGFSSSCHKFDKYAIALIDKGYEVLAFDAPAHGGSEGKTVNAVEYCHMIEQVNNTYGLIDAYIAHSFGGIAVCLALEKIQHSAETKLVLIAPATETTSAITGAFKLLGIHNKKIIASLNETIYNKNGQATAWYSIRRAIKNIKATTLWLHDEEDAITPVADALKVKEDNRPNVKFIITKGLGHQKIYRDSKLQDAIINFL